MNRYGLVELNAYSSVSKSISVASTNKTFVSNIVHEIQNKCVVKKLEDRGNDYEGYVGILLANDSEFKKAFSFAKLYICDSGWEPLNVTHPESGSYRYYFKIKYE